MLRAAEARREGFGAMRATRAAAADVPRPRSRRATTHRAGELGCVNPEFYELPEGRPTFRVFTTLRPERS